ncbi:MAG: MBL fold metallo-hydrolase, partial [Candidatus Methanomethylophilaceae archaeon]|nr:MBL fold metallo-hydrolase [Candidatus Methanomethylophilaceae archaeon]
PRMTRYAVAEGASVTVIEPPCGSNVIILESEGETLFVDTGYACYRDETLKAVREAVPGFDGMRKRVLVTHADLDHIGLCHLFDEVLAGENSALCMREEYEGRDGFRESNPLHKPYIGMCKILTGYEPVPAGKVVVMWPARPECDALLYPVGFLSLGRLRFEVYEGRGGHLKGEVLLIDYSNKVALTGDVYVNVHGMTEAQAQYNRYAPFLMNSVDTDPELCKAEREDLMRRLGPGDWMIFGGHGSMKEHKVRVEGKGRGPPSPAKSFHLAHLGFIPA